MPLRISNLSAEEARNKESTICLCTSLVSVSTPYSLCRVVRQVTDCQVLVLFASALGAGFPVAAKKIKWLKVPPNVFFACKHFGTGVLVATAFVHVSILISCWHFSS